MWGPPGPADVDVEALGRRRMWMWMWRLAGRGGFKCWLGSRRGAPRAVSVSVRPRSGKFLAFIEPALTLTIVFLIQNYQAFVRGRLAKIRISSVEYLIFGGRPRSARRRRKFCDFGPLWTLAGGEQRRSAPSASPKKILRFRGQFDHFGAGCGGCGGLGRGCGCKGSRKVDVRPSGPGGCGCAGSRGRSHLDVYGPYVTPEADLRRCARLRHAAHASSRA